MIGGKASSSGGMAGGSGGGSFCSGGFCCMGTSLRISSRGGGTMANEGQLGHSAGQGRQQVL